MKKVTFNKGYETKKIHVTDGQIIVGVELAIDHDEETISISSPSEEAVTFKEVSILEARLKNRGIKEAIDFAYKQINNRKILAATKEFDDKEIKIKCSLCECDLDHSNYGISQGTSTTLYPGYGSIHDTYEIKIIICDQCIEDNFK